MNPFWRNISADAGMGLVMGIIAAVEFALPHRPDALGTVTLCATTVVVSVITGPVFRRLFRPKDPPA